VKTYESIQSFSYHPESRDHHVASDSYHQPFWLHTQDQFMDYLSLNLPSDESIMEAMNVEELPWWDIHHRSSFFPDIQYVEDRLQSMVSPNIATSPQNPILTRHVLSEGNMGNIMETRPIEISVKPSIIEHLHIGQNGTPEEVTTLTSLFKEFCDVFTWSYE